MMDTYEGFPTVSIKVAEDSFNGDHLNSTSILY